MRKIDEWVKTVSTNKGKCYDDEVDKQ